MIVRVAAGRMGDAVLRPMIGAIGAQTDLGVERIQDATLIVDTILGSIGTDPISAILRRSEHGLEIAIGPLADGEGVRMLDDDASPDTGSVVGALGLTAHGSIPTGEPGTTCAWRSTARADSPTSRRPVAPHRDELIANVA